MGRGSFFEITYTGLKKLERVDFNDKIIHTFLIAKR